MSGTGIRARSLHAALGVALLAGAALALYSPRLTHAQMRGSVDPNAAAEAIARFTGPRWSMIRPARDFQGGCVVGFLAFQFSATGYFVYNNHVRGSWRIDEIGNLKLRTKDGATVTLIVEGNTLRPARNEAFVKRTELFQRCPT